MEQETKPFWASKTLWVNVVGLSTSVALAFGLDLGLDDEMKASIVGGIMSFVNIILRLMTKAAVTGGIVTGKH